MKRVLALALSTIALALSAGAQESAGLASLKNVKKVFIEKMDNDFDADLRVEITRQFKGSMNVVLDRTLADAVMLGVSREDRTGRGSSTLRALGIDNMAAGTLTLVDASGKIILWSDEAGDRAPWLSSGVLPKSKKTIAERLIKKLRKAVNTAK